MIFSILILGLILSTVLYFSGKEFSSRSEAGLLGVVVCGFCLLLSLGILAGKHADGVAKVEAYNAVKAALSRGGGKNMEDVYGQAIEINASLRASKRFNESYWLDVFVPDEWANLEPLELPE